MDHGIFKLFLGVLTITVDGGWFVVEFGGVGASTCAVGPVASQVCCAIELLGGLSLWDQWGVGGHGSLRLTILGHFLFALERIRFLVQYLFLYR